MPTPKYTDFTPFHTIQYNTINNLYCAEYLTKLSLKGTLSNINDDK